MSSGLHENIPSAEIHVFHAARVAPPHVGGVSIECSCGWSAVMPSVLGVINAYGDHRAAAAVALTPARKG